MELTWLSEAGLDTETGIAYTGGQEKYLSAVQRFYRSFEKNRRKIEEALSAQDFESYMITVHAMKSNARMIGAGELSESFEMLEMAARNGETKVIGENNDRVVASYTRLIEGLKPVEALGDVRASDEISAEVARETGEKLLTALEDFQLALMIGTELQAFACIGVNVADTLIVPCQRLRDAHVGLSVF